GLRVARWAIVVSQGAHEVVTPLQGGLRQFSWEHYKPFRTPASQLRSLSSSNMSHLEFCKRGKDQGSPEGATLIRPFQGCRAFAPIVVGTHPGYLTLRIVSALINRKRPG